MTANKLMKNLQKRLSLSNCLTELMHGLLLAAILMLITAAIVPGDLIMIMTLFAGGFILIFFFRLIVSHIWPFILMIVLALAIPLGLSLDLLTALLLTGSQLIIILRSFIIRLKGPSEASPSLFFGQLPAFALILTLNLLAVHFKLYSISQILFYIVIVYFILAIWRWHTNSLNEQLGRFMSMPTQPTRQIKRYNQLMFAVYAILALLLLSVSPLLGIHRVFPWIGKQLLALLRVILTFIFRNSQETPDSEIVPDIKPEPMMPNQPIAVNETPAWIVILSEIIYYLFAVLLAAALIALMVSLVFKIYRRFYSNSQDQDIAESLIPRLQDDIKKQVKRFAKKLQQPFGRNNEEKIRYSYARLVNYLIRKGLRWQTGYSPRQYAEEASKSHNLDLDQITLIYEKARYANNLCTARDVQQMLVLCRHARKGLK